VNDLQRIALDSFFEFYKNDVETEFIDNQNVVISFPVHFSGFHRIEATVTAVGNDRFLISDGAKVIDELRMAGYSLNRKLRERLELVSKAAQVRVVKDHLITECSLKDLGSSLQRFVEAAKTIGDAYLVQRQVIPRDSALLGLVPNFLIEQNVPFKTKQQLSGEYEKHVVDFYFPPNGVPGLALSVMNNPDRTTSESWAFRAGDIKKVNARTRVGVVYDDEDVRNSSKSLLNGVLDVSVPSSNIPALRSSLVSIGILKRP
jgi:hypothetical protein